MLYAKYCLCCGLLLRSRAAEVERQPCVFMLPSDSWPRRSLHRVRILWWGRATIVAYSLG